MQVCEVNVHVEDIATELATRTDDEKEKAR
jgi:hypothetical protein